MTWIFESFELCAKISGNDVYSIVSDYRKIPYLAIGNKGEKVWEQELDIFGRVYNEKGEKNFVPMRFAGQYFDIETGLCYNRFRHYDCLTGLYIKRPVRNRSPKL